MAKQNKENVGITRAEKKDATKNLIRETLGKKEYKHNDLIEETSKLYAERFAGEETENINDVKGRIGSVLDIMKKDGDVVYEGGMYALKDNTVAEISEKSAPKRTRANAKKADVAEKKEPTKKTVKAKKKQAEQPAEEVLPLPATPLNPDVSAPLELPETEVLPEDKPMEKPQAKKRGRKPKAKVEEPIQKETEVTEEKIENEVGRVALNETKPAENTQEKPQETTAIAPLKETALVEKPKAEIAQKDVMDMSFLFGSPKMAKQPLKIEESLKTEKKEELVATAPVKEIKEVKKDEPAGKDPTENKENNLPTQRPKKEIVKKEPVKLAVKIPAKKPLTADEKLKEAFLKRLRSLGGEYFEYYSVYLLEKYSRRNGRRLEGLKISGGEHDGGIDGEIELTDRLGFRETIYIQSKNWDPDKGDEKLWVVGETLLQQFIGACAYRQAKQGKQHCRGIFITTSRFTPEAKKILENMSDKIVGYDAGDLYETAKECEFGLIKRNGEWALDEKLLSGEKAFFQML